MLVLPAPDVVPLIQRCSFIFAWVSSNYQNQIASAMTGGSNDLDFISENLDGNELMTQSNKSPVFWGKSLPDKGWQACDLALANQILLPKTLSGVNSFIQYLLRMYTF